MNRTFRAAELAAAAVALCAAVSFAAPSMAQNLQAARAAAATTAAPAAAPAQDPEPKGYLARIYNAAMDALVGQGTAAETAGAQRSLDELVQAYETGEAGDREQDCLANAVYFESRGEPVEGQLAVAQVVLNRASSGRYPADLCAVITQKAQFSFIRAGRFPIANRDSEAWRKAVAIARIAHEKLARSVPADVLWYHATYVAPSWGKRLSKNSQIGLHIFYS
jgi:spore germination cell wall hydrolase CwlJ-like protein